jgi:hypothetical protein
MFIVGRSPCRTVPLRADVKRLLQAATTIDPRPPWIWRGSHSHWKRFRAPFNG